MSKSALKSSYDQDEIFVETGTVLPEIADDVSAGLSASPKYLLSKYFYDKEGSRIFQQIMNMPGYYLTNCELEIISENAAVLSRAFIADNSFFRLSELGPGDGIKSRILLKHLISEGANFSYVPVDINREANVELSESLKKELPGIIVQPESGDYLHVIKNMNGSPVLRKIILFLGSNIGNLDDLQCGVFLQDIFTATNPGDKVLIGFDLKKSPRIIMNAYDDPQGLTGKFNLNLLERINRELEADFDLSQFEHHTEYDPVTGMLKSYLVSISDQIVYIKALGQRFFFKQWEPVFIELSRKFSIEQIEKMASDNGFSLERHFFDSRKYFVDSLWIRE